MTIEDSVRNKVIDLNSKGKKRHEIAHELSLSNIPISTGSISNILSEWRQHEESLKKDTDPIKQPLQSSQDSQSEAGARVDTNNKDVSLKNHIIENIQDWEANGYPVEDSQGQTGAPLNWFVGMNGHSSEPAKEPSNPPPSTSSIPPTKPNFPTLEDPTFISEDQVNVNNNDDENYLNNYAESQNVKNEEEEQNQSVLRSSATSHQRSSIDQIKRERYQRPSSLSNEPIISLGIDSETEDHQPIAMDWDPLREDAWERNFLRIVLDDKKQRQQELQLLEQREQELEQREQQMAEIGNSIEQWKTNLKTRESKLAEVAPLIPSAREFQNAGITFDLLMPYLLAINEKSALENIDLKTAAYNMLGLIREYGNLQAVHNAVDKAEQKLSILGKNIRQQQAAITALINLQHHGFTKKQINELVSLVNNWNVTASNYNGNNGHVKKLDTELIGTGHGNKLTTNNTNPGSTNPGSSNSNGSINLQHPDNIDGNNGGNFSMNDFKLNLLKTATTNMLNRMGTNRSN